MVKIEVEIDDAEINVLIKEEWYKQARHRTRSILFDHAEQMVGRYINQNSKEFESMFREELHKVLEKYTIRDLKQIEKILKRPLQIKG